MNVPRSAAGCEFEMSSRSPESIASTKPSPSTLSEARCEITLWPGSTRSWMFGCVARSWISEPPGCSMNVDPLKKPARRLGDLARAAEERHQVALAASGGVEDRAEAIGDGFGTGEFLRGLVHLRLRDEPVRQSVESGGRLGRPPPAPRGLPSSRAATASSPPTPQASAPTPHTSWSPLAYGYLLLRRTGVRPVPRKPLCVKF